jgi:glycosyltransferase involved in cell wall biosynthesis
VSHLILDARFGGSPTGLGRFTRELTTAVLDASPTHLRWTLLTKEDQPPWLEGRPVRTIQSMARHYSLAEQWALPRLLWRHQPDLFVSWHFNVPLACPVPFVATVHDLILHAYPNAASPLKQLAYRLLMRHAVLHSRGLLAVSPFVAEELVRVYGTRIESRLMITGEGAPPTFGPRDLTEQQRVREAWNVPGPFLLYVGNAKEHKRVPLLLEAFQAAQLPGVSLVLVASGPEADRLTLPANVRRLQGVPDTDLPALYSAALACVTASAHEGFYLPGVEALTCGCPVVAPRTSAIIGTLDGAEGVALVEPTLDGLTAGLRTLPHRSEPQQRWHWADAAHRVLESIERALSTNH